MSEKFPTFIIKLKDKDVYYLTTGVLEYNEANACGSKKEEQVKGCKKVKAEFHKTTFHDAKIVSDGFFAPLNTEPQNF
jgi:hypothetical protein